MANSRPTLPILFSFLLLLVSFLLPLGLGLGFGLGWRDAAAGKGAAAADRGQGESPCAVLEAAERALQEGLRARRALRRLGVFSPGGKLYEYSSSSSIQDTYGRYQQFMKAGGDVNEVDESENHINASLLHPCIRLNMEERMLINDTGDTIYQPLYCIPCSLN